MLTSSDIKYMIIMRHGEQCSINGLTKTGKSQVKTSAKTLEKERLSPDFLISSFPERTKISANILSKHFNLAVARTMDLLDIYGTDFSMQDFLETLPESRHVIAISGHEETIQLFGHTLLNEQDRISLFSLLPQERILDVEHNNFHSLHATASHADAMILKAAGNAKEEKSWKLFGYLAGGAIMRLQDVKNSDLALKGAKYFLESPDMIDIAIRLPAEKHYQPSRQGESLSL